MHRSYSDDFSFFFFFFWVVNTRFKKSSHLLVPLPGLLLALVTILSPRGSHFPVAVPVGPPGSHPSTVCHLTFCPAGVQLQEPLTFAGWGRQERWGFPLSPSSGSRCWLVAHRSPRARRRQRPPRPPAPPGIPPPGGAALSPGGAAPSQPQAPWLQLGGPLAGAPHSLARAAPGGEGKGQASFPALGGWGWDPVCHFPENVGKPLSQLALSRVTGCVVLARGRL